MAVADVNGDGKLDVVAGAGFGGAPHVKVFDGAGGAELASFFAFDWAFRGGVLVAAGDVDGDGAVEVLAVAGAAGAPHVRGGRPRGAELLRVRRVAADSPYDRRRGRGRRRD